jgi:hypothetical protein
MPDFMNNNYVQGSGHLAQAYANLVLKGDFGDAYEEFTTALALFKAHDIIPKVMSDVKVKANEFEKVRAQAAPKPSE